MKNDMIILYIILAVNVLNASILMAKKIILYFLYDLCGTIFKTITSVLISIDFCQSNYRWEVW